MLSLLLAGFGVPAAAEPHLGRSPGVDDAVTANLKLRQDRPSVEVRVSNPTGRPLLLRGWLDGQEASAVVPEQSAIVTLSWGTVTDGELVLELYPDEAGGGRAVDRETYLAGVRGDDYYYYDDNPVTPQPRDGSDAELAVRDSSVWVSDQEAPVPVPSPAVALPVTGVRLEPYVLLGGGLLGFGLLVLGLSWMVSRRSPTD